MVINALNCGASVFMADFEDASSPTWFNLVDGRNGEMRWRVDPARKANGIS
jgi:malate synthase